MLVMVIGFAYFAVHTVLTPIEKSFFDYHLLRNQNYVTGLLFVFIIGMVLFATRALTPSMLQNLMNYPVLNAGLVTAPSGIGTMIAMIVVGRVVGRIDVRLLLLAGFSITAVSLWQMSSYTLEVAQPDIVWPGVIQGFGLGLVWVPLSVAAFATLPPVMRSQGTAIYSLMRNIGSSIGISLVQTLLVRNTQIVHASLVEKAIAGNPAFQDPAIASIYNLGNPAGLGVLNAEISRQAAMIAYLDDFWLMLILTLLAIPLLALIRPAKKAAPAPAEVAAME